jgi:hypothetical protein
MLMVPRETWRERKRTREEVGRKVKEWRRERMIAYQTQLVEVGEVSR